MSKEHTPAEIAASLRKLADEIDAGDFKSITHTDDTETCLAGVHKGMKIKVTTGNRRVLLDLQTKNYRPVDLGMLVDLCETALKQTDVPKKLAVIAEKLGPRARAERD